MSREKEKEEEANKYLPKEYNPFYDSNFLISFDDENGRPRRFLVELYEDDLRRLRAEIDYILNRHTE